MARPNSIRAKLRAMPVDKRAEAIVEIFRIIAAEFAAMVLEHVKPPNRGAHAKAKKKAKPRRPARR